MKKLRAAPAFQFYPSDWMSGSPGRMTPEETHAYIWLLCLDWEQSGFVYDEKRLSHWCRLTRPRFRKAWDTVRQNFEERDGRLYNPRLEKERAKQLAWQEQLSAAGREGAERRWGHQKGKPRHSDPNGHPNGHPTSKSREKAREKFSTNEKRPAPKTAASKSQVVENQQNADREVNGHPNREAYGENMPLQTSVNKVRSTTNPPKTSARAGTSEGARTREQDELDALNRRRVARGEEPVDAL